MTSKNLFFKVCFHDFKKRIWSFACFFVVMFFAFPVHILLAAQNYKGGWLEPEKYLPYITGYYKEIVFGFDNLALLILLVAGAVLLAMSGFSYLNSRKKVDFTHSMPIKREAMFFSRYLVGVANYLIPLALNMGIGLIIIATRGEMEASILKYAGCYLGINLVYFLLFYSVAILAIVLVGNIVVSFLGIFVFYFYQTLACYLVKVFKSWFFYTYMGAYDKLTAYDPMALLIRQVTKISNCIEYSDYGTITVIHYEETLAPMYISIGIIVAVVIAAMFLFKKRPSESAGKALVFPISEPIIKVAILVPCVMGGGLLMFGISYSESVSWYIFGGVISYVLLALILEMIFRLDFKAALKHKVSAIVAGVLAIVCSMLFFLDLGNFDKRLPKEEDIVSMGITFDGIGMESYYDDYYDEWGNAENTLLQQIDLRDEGLKAAYELATYLVENNVNTRVIRETMLEDLNDTEEVVMELPVDVCYRLKNGREIYRTYTVPCTDEFLTLVEGVYNNENYKMEVFPIFEDDFKYDVFYYTNQFEENSVRITAEEREKILELYKEDVKTLTFSQIMEAAPIINFGLTYSRLDRSTSLNYPIYESFEKTIEYLEELGVSTEIDYDKLVIHGLTVCSCGEEYKEVNYSNLEQQREILENCDNFNRGYNRYGYNFVESYYEVMVDYEYGDNSGYTNLYLKNVPDFVEADFQN